MQKRDAAKARRKPSRAKQLGVTDTEYKRLLERQYGHCALCPNTPKTRRLHVDHNHRTGKVRGLLCYACNRNLPYYATSDWLLRAYYYCLADEHPERSRTPVPDPDAELDQWADAR